ncbi:MAG: hypothetical protein ACRD5Z_11885, partial [Bryobacteraceae bacterium]
FPLAALAALLLVFTSCERHRPSEWPEVQREHLHPRQSAAAEAKAEQPPAQTASPTPANFFPKQQP